MSDKELSAGERGSDIPHPVDVHVGNRIKLQRNLMGITQGKLGESIGLTFQQIQKYERGANRVSASKLWQLSNVLEVPIGYFFDEMPSEVKSEFPGYDKELAEENLSEDEKEELILHQRQTLELVRTFSKLADSTLRKRIIDLVRAMVEALTKD